MTERHDPASPMHDLDDEALTARLLRLASLRAGTPPERANRVRRAVLEECRRVAQARRVRRAAAIAAVLSTAAAVLVVVRFLPAREAVPTPAGRIATIERLEGAGPRLQSLDGAGGPVAVALATMLRPGDRIETGRSGRVALRLSGGASLRIDRDTSARLLSSRVIELDGGAVYVDGGRDSADLEIRTPLGVVRDIGTQFEVRLADSSMRVRVRSGLVEVQRDARVSTARPGTELTIDGGGSGLGEVSPFGPEWGWAERLAPPFAIEGRPLAAFLDHVCREQGWTLAYDHAALARESSGIILHGSVDGLDPEQAVTVVLATAGLRYRLDAGELLISRAVPR